MRSAGLPGSILGVVALAMATQVLPEPQPVIHLTPKRKKFLDYYFGEANRVATRAAKLAGYRCEGTAGSRTKRLLAKEIAARELELAESSRMSADEVLVSLTEIARDANHKDRCRALELMAKIHGLMAEKLNITLDRKGMQQELSGALVQLSGLAGRKTQLQLPEANSAPSQDIK